MKLVAFLAISTILPSLVHCASPDFVVPSSKSIVAKFTPPQSLLDPKFSLDFKNIAVDKNTGFVYIGADNWIFQLDANLSLLAFAKPAPDTFPVRVSLRPSANHILVINYEFDLLITCGSVYHSRNLLQNSTCGAWKLENVTQFKEISAEMTVKGYAPSYAFIAPGNSKNVLYAGAVAPYSRAVSMQLSTYNLNPTSRFSLTSKTSNYDTTGSKQYSKIIYGFSSEGFSYFLSAPNQGDSTTSRLISVCQNDPKLYTFASIPIKCAVSESGKTFDDLQAAYAGNPGADLAKDLNITVDQDVLFALFRKSRQSFALCVFSIKNIREKIRESINSKQIFTKKMSEAERDYCKADYFGSELNDNTRHTSHSIFAVGEPAFVFNQSLVQSGLIATSSGRSTAVFLISEEQQLKKFLLTSPTTAVEYFTSNDIESDYFRRKNPADSSYLFNTWKLAFDPNRQHLYLLDGETVFKVPVYTCLNFMTLETCIDAVDPLCGWCTRSKKCTSEESCDKDQLKDAAPKSNGITEGWITCTRKAAQLPEASEDRRKIDFANSRYVDLSTEYPSVCYKTVNCTYSNETWEQGRGLPKTEIVRCLIPQVSLGSSSKIVDLLVTMEKRGFFPSTTLKSSFEFYDCNYHKSQDECNASKFACGWKTETQKCESIGRIFKDMKVYEDAKPVLNQTYKITCELDSQQSALPVWWTKDNLTSEDLRNSGLTLVETEVIGTQIGTLQFHSLELSHFGNYECHTVDGLTKSILVSTNTPPLVQLEKTGEVAVGSKIVLTCFVIGYPLNGSLSWTFRSEKVEKSQDLTIEQDKNITFWESKITIDYFSTGANGTFSCNYDAYEKPVDLIVPLIPVGMTWESLSETPTGGDKSLIRYKDGEPVLLNCQGIPDRIPASEIAYYVDYADGTSSRLRTNPFHDTPSQAFAFLSEKFNEAELRCGAEVIGETQVFGSTSFKMKLVDSFSDVSYNYEEQETESLASSLYVWCNSSKTCSMATTDDFLDSTATTDPFGFMAIRMNPPEIMFYDTINLTNQMPKIVPLPETASMKNVKQAVIRAESSGSQVIWTHSPEGHLWLTNVETGTSVPLKKDFRVVNMDVDWNKKIVFGVSEKDRKCVFRLDLENLSGSVTKIFVEEEIISIAVNEEEHIYYVSKTGKINWRDVASGSEVQLFKGYQNPYSLPKSLTFQSPEGLMWVQDYFDKISVVYQVLSPDGVTLPRSVRRYVQKGLIKGIRHNQAFDGSCPKCSHFCNLGLRRPCGCPWRLDFRNQSEDTCTGKWIHFAVTLNASTPQTNLISAGLSNATEVLQETQLNSHRVRAFPLIGSAEKPCYAFENASGSIDLVYSNTSMRLSIGLDSVLAVLPSNSGSEVVSVDVFFVEDSCFRIVHSKTNGTWILFCGKINPGNVAIDTKSWTVFWENNEKKDVQMTNLHSLISRQIVDSKYFQFGQQVDYRLALDSTSSVLYWIHGPNIWSRSYKNSETLLQPTLLWKSASTPKQLQFHDGFLYWIETKTEETTDNLVIFDIEFRSIQTLIPRSIGKLSSFSIQSYKPAASSASVNCEKCSHFCGKFEEDHKCYCPYKKPILASNGTCHEPILNLIVQDPGSNFKVIKSQTPQNSTQKFSVEAPAGTKVFTSSQGVQCWLQGPLYEIECSILNSAGNETKSFGSAHSTNPLFSSSSSTKELIFNTGNETGKYGALTLANIETGQTLTFDPVKEDQINPFAFDHRRKLAVWCSDRDLTFHEVGGSHLDSFTVSNEINRCEQNSGTCTSLALDEVKGRAFFIYGKELRTLDYASKNFSKVTVLYGMEYPHFSSLSFDGKANLFWAGGFLDSGEFVDMIKVPEKTGEKVATIRILDNVPSKIVQVEAVREKTPEGACDTSNCRYFCFPQNRWNSEGAKCYCPTDLPLDGVQGGGCEPLYEKFISGSGDKDTNSTNVGDVDADPMLKIIIGICSAVVVLTLIIFGVITTKKRGNQEEDYKKAVALFFEGDQSSAKMIENPVERSYFVPFTKTIPPGDINLTDAKQLGTGQFGAVFCAKYKDEPAAVKIIKHGSDKEKMKEFLKEIKIMAYIGEHAHIVQMYGAEVSNLNKGGVLVVLELCPHGDLQEFLRKYKKNLNNPEAIKGSNQYETRIDFSILADWSRQIAKGLAYLEEKNVVHGDLATRNVLLFDDNVVKVSDFGFSRKTYGDQYKKSNKQTPLPFRWAAPETLDDLVFSSQSDVWSYGVTVWEIFSFAKCPFAQESWDLTFSARLREGSLRLEKPEGVTDAIYEGIMMKCWRVNPDDRPNFVEIVGFWDNFV